MDRIVSAFSRLFGRVELLARGLDGERRAAEDAMSRGRWMEAYGCARMLLQRVPDSPVGLALLAEASNRSGLWEEEAWALEGLARKAPWRSDLWLQLGQVRRRLGQATARQDLERASMSGESAVARTALLALADLEIAAGLHARATHWLDRIPQHPGTPDPALGLRRLECALARDDTSAIAREAKSLRPQDGRSRLAAAQAKLRIPELDFGAPAIALASAAWILDADGAEKTARLVLSQSNDLVWVARFRQIAETKGVLQTAAWQAALALAEGRRSDAQAALLDSLEQGDSFAAEELQRLANETEDVDLLATVAATAPEFVSDELHRVLAAVELHQEGCSHEGLLQLQAMPVQSFWAERVERQILREVLAAGHHDPQALGTLLALLAETARELREQAVAAQLELLMAAMDRPLTLAVVGEFNAGKSTFLNALLRAEVAPMGVRPTTACLHRLAWAPDPIARIVTQGRRDRIVSHEKLRETLKSLEEEGASVEQVFLYAPIEALRRAEILDTPGFNASHKEHKLHAQAGIEQADVALWLLDATAPLKNTERGILEGIREASVPLIVLLNKADRLDPDARAKVVDYVAGSLSELGLATLLPPQAISAREALRHRAAPETSTAHAREYAGAMDRIEEALADKVVSQKQHWRGQTLLRKLKVYASDLLERTELRAEEEESAHAARLQKRAVVRQRAHLLCRSRTSRNELGDTILDGLAEPLRALRDDLAPLGAVVEEERDEPELRSYRVNCTQARLTPAVAEVLRRELQLDEQQTAEVIGQLESSFGGSAAVADARLAGDALLAALDAAILAAAKRLSVTQPDEERSGHVACHRQRLVALLDVLSA